MSWSASNVENFCPKWYLSESCSSVPLCSPKTFRAYCWSLAPMANLAYEAYRFSPSKSSNSTRSSCGRATVIYLMDRVFNYYNLWQTVFCDVKLFFIFCVCDFCFNKYCNIFDYLLWTYLVQSLQANPMISGHMTETAAIFLPGPIERRLIFAASQNHGPRGLRIRRIGWGRLLAERVERVTRRAAANSMHAISANPFTAERWFGWRQ